MNFYSRKNENKSGNSPSSFDWKKITALIAGLLILVYLGWQAKDFYTHLTANWAEVKFAYEKPYLVKSLRVNFENKQKKFEESLVRQEKSSEEKLLEQIAEELKNNRSK